MHIYHKILRDALKKADALIDVGEKQRALDALYDVIKIKENRTWQKIHEPIMIKYLELCVELKKSREAKEGLFEYLTICQQIHIKSLGNVLRGYLSLAEKKTTAARDKLQLDLFGGDDLDDFPAPARVLGLRAKYIRAEDGWDRTPLGKWVKFLLESYQQCLELLRNNFLVERLYHDIAQQALEFCLKYRGKTEFRNMQTHLSHIHEHQTSMKVWPEAYEALDDIPSISLGDKRLNTWNPLEEFDIPTNNLVLFLIE